MTRFADLQTYLLDYKNSIAMFIKIFSKSSMVLILKQNNSLIHREKRYKYWYLGSCIFAGVNCFSRQNSDFLSERYVFSFFNINTL